MPPCPPRAWIRTLFSAGCPRNWAGNKASSVEKGAITAPCEKMIAEVLRPRFLPEVRPSAASTHFRHELRAARTKTPT